MEKRQDVLQFHESITGVRLENGHSFNKISEGAL